MPGKLRIFWTTEEKNVVAGDVHDEFKRIDILVNALSAQSSVQRQGASLRRLHGSVVGGRPCDAAPLALWTSVMRAVPSTDAADIE